MLDIFGLGILHYALSFYMLFSTHVDRGISDISRMENNRGAVLMAQSSIEQNIYTIKTAWWTRATTDKFMQVSSVGPQEDLKFGRVNSNYAGYFASELLTAPQEDIDLGSIAGSDLVFRGTKPEDIFDSMTINYDSPDKNEQLEVVIVRATRWPIGRCSYTDFESISGCTTVKKFVINTGDALQNGIVTLDWYTVWFRVGDAGFRRKVDIGWFSPSQYDYRVMFATLSGRSTPMTYYVTSAGAKKRLPNNIVEVDTTWIANDTYARFKLRKRIVDESQPLNRYVLFGDEQIIK